MKKTLTTQKLICSVVMSAILSGCLPGNIGGSSDVNNNVTPYSGPEHLIDKDPNKKLSKEELYKKVSRDYENRPAKVDQKKVIDNTLVKLPWQLLYKHDDTNSSIERVASDWEGTLTRHSIEPNQRIKDMNGKDVAAKDLPAHLYRDNGKLKILVRADDGINYASNGENRKQLLYATIKAMLSGHEVELDGNFIQALRVEKNNRYLEGNNVKELLAISDLTAEIINDDKYREIAENALAYLLVNYHEEPEGMTYFYPEMASYLDKFEHDKLADFWEGQTYPATDIMCRSICTKQQIKTLNDIDVNFARIFEDKTQLNFYQSIGGVITDKEMAEKIFQIRYENLPNLDANSRKVLFDNLGKLEKIGYSDAYQLLVDPVLITKPQLFAELVKYAENNKLNSIWELREQYRKTLPTHTYYRGMALSEAIKDQYVANEYLTPRLYGEIDNIDLDYNPVNDLINLPQEEKRTDIFFNQYTVLADKNADDKSYLVPRVDLYGNLGALLLLHTRPAAATKSAASLFGEQATDNAKVYDSEIELFRKLFGGDYLKKNPKSGKYTIADSAVRYKVSNSFPKKISQFSALSSITPYKEVAASAALIAQKDSEQKLYIFKLEMTDLDFLSYSDIFPLEYSKDLTTTQKELLDRLRTLDNDALENELSSWDKNDSSFNKKSEMWELAVSERFQRNVEQFVYGTIKISEVDSITQDDYNADLIKDYTKNNTKIKQLLVKDGLLYDDKKQPMLR